MKGHWWIVHDTWGLDISYLRSRHVDSMPVEIGAKNHEGLWSSIGERAYTTMDDNNQPLLDAEPSMEPYLETIGYIMYLMVGTRPDLSYLVCTFPKFVESPTAIHCLAVQSELKNFLSTKTFCCKIRQTQSNSCSHCIDWCKLGWRYYNREIYERLSGSDGWCSVVLGWATTKVCCSF